MTSLALDLEQAVGLNFKKISLKNIISFIKINLLFFKKLFYRKYV